LFALILKRKGWPRRPDEYAGGFIELWRLSLDKRVEDHAAWLIAEITAALQVNLQFANDLYNYWRIEYRGEQLDSRPTPELRAAVIAKAKETYVNGETLLRALDATRRWSVKRFAITFSQPEMGEPGFRPEEWVWLMDLLIEAAEMHPPLVIPQIAHLLVDGVILVEGGYSFRFDENRALNLFRDWRQAMTYLLEEMPIEGLSDESLQALKTAREGTRALLLQNRN
jgi:hypothetical protein